jgi:hypothetical protein
MSIEEGSDKSFIPPVSGVSIPAIASISGMAISLQPIQQGVTLISGRIPISGPCELPLYKHPQTIVAAVSFWTETVGAHIIEYDSVNKKTFHKEWSTEDDTNIDYKANLQKGLYSKGIAVRTGKLYHGQYKDFYLCCIDFDSEEGFLAWCAEDYNLDILAKWTRVDWHKNPKRIHVFFISKTPLKDLARNRDNQIIEVYGEKPHLVCVYGNHKDGNLIEPYDTEKIVAIDGITKLELENRVKMVTPSYLNGDNDYVKELEKPETIVPKGSVHIAVRAMLMSVYFRWTGEFADMSDEKRFQWVVDWDRQKAIQAGRPAYINANPGKLEKLYEGIKRKYQGQRQKERDEREETASTKKRNKFSHIASLAGKIVAEISHDPLKLVVCDPIAKNVCYVNITKIEVEQDNQKIKFDKVQFGRIALNTSLVEVSIYQNPLEFLRQPDKYCIKFDSHQRGSFTLEGSIDSILKQLDEMGVVMYQYGAKESLTWMINEFINLGKASISKSVDFEGVVFYDGDLHISRIDFAKKHPASPTKEECFGCTEYLEKRTKFNVWEYNGRTIDRRDWLASSIKWTLPAPFDFALKQISGQYQRWFSFSGDRDAGKTEMSNEMLEIHGNLLGNNVNSKYSLGAGEFDTSPKLGRALAKTTYPISVSEFGKIEEKGRNGDYAEDLKNAIEKLISRSGKDGANYDVSFPSCSPVMINGNPKLSASDTIIKRFDNVKFTKEDAHKPTDQRTIEFNEFRKQNRGKLKILGDWSMNYIWDNRQELILSGKYSYRELGDLVIRRFYEFAGVEF